MGAATVAGSVATPWTRWTRRIPAPHPHARWPGYAFAVAAVALVTALIGLALRWTDLPNSSPLYLIAVLAAAALYGRGPAVLAAVLAFAAFDFFFVEPVHILTAREPREWLTPLVFPPTALVTRPLP